MRQCVWALYIFLITPHGTLSNPEFGVSFSLFFLSFRVLASAISDHILFFLYFWVRVARLTIVHGYLYFSFMIVLHPLKKNSFSKTSLMECQPSMKILLTMVDFAMGLGYVNLCKVLKYVAVIVLQIVCLMRSRSMLFQ